MQSDHDSTVIDVPARIERRPEIADGWETARQLGFPAALWRLPNQREKHLVVAFDDVLPRVAADLEELPTGFAISPFDNLDNGTDTPARTLFLRADVHAVSAVDGSASITYLSGTKSDQFRQALSSLRHRERSENTIPVSFVHVPEPDAQAAYEQNVAEAVAAMQQGAFRKVVLSRTKQVDFADAPNAVALFDKLCETYPAAFVSAVALPEKGQIWISATPERLVSQDGAGHFRTVSLAGTQLAYGPDGTPKRPAEAMWSQKEIEEQALVNRYIIECFKKIRLREYVEEGPKTIIAGNLMHLCTQFTVDTQAVHYPQLGTVMLRLLHPTSAVCGMPRDAAFDFIRTHEPHDREFYSGFLGPVNVNTNHEGPASALFVHIRCMKLEGSTATLYAGAGLTEDSLPEREWHETEIKCQTLLACLGN